jgi:hypothetical protein
VQYIKELILLKEIRFNELQPLKESSPIEVTYSEVKLSKAEQPMKAQSSTHVNLFTKVTFFILVLKDI